MSAAYPVYRVYRVARFCRHTRQTLAICAEALTNDAACALACELRRLDAEREEEVGYEVQAMPLAQQAELLRFGAPAVPLAQAA